MGAPPLALDGTLSLVATTKATATTAAVTSPLPAPQPSPWHESMMRQLESWDRFLA